VTRTIAYLRVSSEQQADHGISLDAQRAKVEAYAALYDLTLVEVIVDAGVSAKSLKRPGLQRALGMLRSGAADALLVTKLDRLTRSLPDLGTLLPLFADGKRSLLSVGEQIDTRSASGRLVLSLLTSVASWEREAIGERTAAALAHKKSRGEKLGGAHAPYGYSAVTPEGGKAILVPVEHEQSVISEARDLRTAGLSYAAIAATLTERGRRARNGKALLPTQVARMVAA
jgi:DNA invertase Pin-like site-specific DNA recombinase